MSFFVPHMRYVPNLEMIGEYLDQEQTVGMCKRTPPEAYVRITHPRSLEQAADKVAREEKKKATAERNKFTGGGE